MSTRSLTRVFEDGDQIVCMYRQCDGYPSGLGQELAEFLHGMKITNGIGANEGQRTANGGGCLAAQIIAHFKDDVGNVYLEPITIVNAGQEYEYEVHVNGRSTVELRCYDVTSTGDDTVKRELLFAGTPAAYMTWAKTL